jgi:hypothetical protein
MVVGHARAVSVGALAAMLPAVLIPLASAPTPAVALSCEATIDAASIGALAELQDLLDRPREPDEPARSCATWTLRLAGTFLLESGLIYRGEPTLRLVGMDAAAPAVLTGGGGHRIVSLLAPASRLELTDLVLRGGDARGADLDGAGGAVAIEEQLGVVSELRATRVAFRSNDAARGGAVAVDRAILVEVEVEGNSADAGGGLDVFELQATRTTFVDNRATTTPGTGGAVRASGDVTLENVTFSANAAQVGGSVWLTGTGSPTLRATFSTFASVRSTEAGAHLYADLRDGGGATLVLRGSVVIGSAALDADDSAIPANCAGFVAWLGPADDDDGTASRDSFADDASCGPRVTELPLTPTLAALPQRQDRAGTGPGSRVQLPAADGPLVDVVDCDGTWPLTDQRGVVRPQPSGGRCDAGAVELTALPPLGPPPQPPALPQGLSLPSEVRAGEGASPRRPALTFWRWPRGR